MVSASTDVQDSAEVMSQDVIYHDMPSNKNIFITTLPFEISRTLSRFFAQEMAPQNAFPPNGTKLLTMVIN